MAELVNNYNSETIRINDQYFTKIILKISNSLFKLPISLSFYNIKNELIHIFWTSFGRISNEHIYIDKYSDVIEIYLENQQTNIECIVCEKNNTNYEQRENIKIPLTNKSLIENIKNYNLNDYIKKEYDFTNQILKNNNSGWRVVVKQLDNNILVKQISNENNLCYACFGRLSTNVEFTDLLFKLYPKQDIVIPNSCLPKSKTTIKAEDKFGVFKLIQSKYYSNNNVMFKMLISNLISLSPSTTENSVFTKSLTIFD